MIRKGLLLSAVLALLAVRPAPVAAQFSLGVACAPGIPNCGALQFLLVTGGSEVALNDLNIVLLSPGTTFTGGLISTVGTYDAVDSFGPFSGFTTIGAGGTSLFINFQDNGFPLDVLAGATGTLDVADSGPGNVNGLYYSFTGHTVTGETIAATVTPEPVTLALFGTGLGALGLFRRRKRKSA